MSTLSATYESVPRYLRMPRDVHREHLRVIALALLEAGERVSVQRLRECGVRGGTAALIALRQELVASGELPPEAAARVYARPVHPPGKASRPLPTPPGARFQPPPVAPVAQPGETLQAGSVDARPKLTRAQRRSRRLIERYDSAVGHIFGLDRARQIGAIR
jgi:hypothetical protein